jgi:hypothetical protein
VESFGEGFDRLISLKPQEIQVGILKRLRGTPIVHHDAEWRMIYNPHPPYEILQTKLIDFATLQRLRRFARYWDLIGNSGNFVESAPLLWQNGASPFKSFLAWTDWLYGQIGRTDSIALVRLMELFLTFLTDTVHLDRETAAETLWRDYQRGGRRDLPEFLRKLVRAVDVRRTPNSVHSPVPKRQARHLV